MKIELIVAVADNGIIGVNGKMPWTNKDDLARFAAITKGHAVIMGRKTWESLPKKPLTGRMNIVLSSNVSYYLDKATVVNSLESAVEVAKLRGYARVFIIGGEAVYNEVLAKGLVSSVHITILHKTIAVKPTDIVTKFDFRSLPQFKASETYHKLELL